MSQTTTLTRLVPKLKSVPPDVDPLFVPVSSSTIPNRSLPVGEASCSLNSPPGPLSFPAANTIDFTTRKAAVSTDTALFDAYGKEFKLPDYTIKQIRDAIPAHCYQRSALRGFLYVARDLSLLGSTFYLFHSYVTLSTIPSAPVRVALWSLYTLLQGFYGTGLWVLAHECGHQAFSESRSLNDITGWVLHSALLVPYFSFKLSHSKHHAYTGNLARDMVLVPNTREVYATRIGRLAHELSELTEETPIWSALELLGLLLLGWPLYLLSNEGGHNNHATQREGRGIGKQNGLGGGVNHFDPNSPLFESKDARLILWSNAGLAITGSILYYLGHRFGWANLVVWYFIPYLWVNHWLGTFLLSSNPPPLHPISPPSYLLINLQTVSIAYLQHTDLSLPHYTPHSWTFTRGAAATIDRDFGFIGRHLFHSVIETHVLHHYVSTIPFYHAAEATEAIKGVMGECYRSDTTGGPLGWLGALWSVVRGCQWVEEGERAGEKGTGVYWFRSRNGRGRGVRVLGASLINIHQSKE